jgi:hypothetical protein
MKKLIASGLTIAALTVSVLGCNSSSTTPPQRKPVLVAPKVATKPVHQVAIAQPIDPRPVFLKTGAKYDELDTSAVQRDVYEDKYLCGYTSVDSFGDGTGEEICVYTYANAQDENADLERNLSPRDGSRAIRIPGKFEIVWVTPSTNQEGNFVFSPSLTTIATRVGGTV